MAIFGGFVEDVVDSVLDYCIYKHPVVTSLVLLIVFLVGFVIWTK